MSLPDLPQLPETEWKLHMPARQYECEWTSSEDGYTSDQMLEYANQYAALAVAAERERCAKICEDLSRWKSTNAPRIEALEGLKNHYHELAERGAEAIKTLESEREANAILTAENEALRAPCAILFAMAAERERCAKICEDLESDGMSWLEAGTCAAAIRNQP